MDVAARDAVDLSHKIHWKSGVEKGGFAINKTKAQVAVNVGFVQTFAQHFDVVEIADVRQINELLPGKFNRTG